MNGRRWDVAAARTPKILEARMVTLRPMEQEEFDTFMARQRQNYPAERARNFSSPVEREREQAERQFADLLPQ